MARIIVIANQKGGVGKTTTAVNLSSCVAQQGKNVLLVDVDPQGNATSGIGIDKTKCKYSVYDALVNGVATEKTILRTKIPTLHIIPSRIELAGAEVELVSMMAREQKLKSALRCVLHMYDYIFVDCPP